MKRISTYIILILLSILPSTAETLMQQADSAYTREDYRQALRLYQEAINSEGVSADLYYNMGNAYYRINNPGKAILCYRRALNIDPSYPDARQNLMFVQSQLTDLPENDNSFLSNLHRRVCSIMSPDAWAWTSLIFFTLLLGCVALYLFCGDVKYRKVGFFGGIAVLLLTIYASIIAFSTARAHTHNNDAVVITDGAHMYSAPGTKNTGDKNETVIGQGAIVEITDSVTIPGDDTSPMWYHVKINNSTKAWINASNVERI